MANLQDFIITGSLNLKESTPAVDTTGSVWFDASSGRLQYCGYGAAWSSGGTMITARDALAGAGTQNEGLAFGGRPSCACTEEYNGSSWSTGGGLIRARQCLAGAGTQNEGLAFGGYNPACGPSAATRTLACTEEYNGSSWSAGGALITARYLIAGAGTQNSGIAAGGFRPTSPAILGCTEEYNGTSWSSGGNLITARYSLGGAGTQNEGLIFGGRDPSFNVVTCTEEYDGTSWAAGGALITARYDLAGAGTQNSGLAFGGQYVPVNFTCTEEYNGTSWSAGGALITGRFQLAGAGTQAAGLAFGGVAFLTCTEEYIIGNLTKTL